MLANGLPQVIHWQVHDFYSPQLLIFVGVNLMSKFLSSLIS